ncbi:metal tolerance protein C4 [Senna tora]|uniref:Metal tolerance protein C4 n=1 Tax=Senna tora TaxID=362788 RepID=A0A834T5Q2_9FABA|nr:metal tolerance protein C4 [Senna tora]
MAVRGSPSQRPAWREGRQGDQMHAPIHQSARPPCWSSREGDLEDNFPGCDPSLKLRPIAATRFGLSERGHVLCEAQDTSRTLYVQLMERRGYGEEYINRYKMMTRLGDTFYSTNNDPFHFAAFTCHPDFTTKESHWSSNDVAHYVAKNLSSILPFVWFSSFSVVLIYAQTDMSLLYFNSHNLLIAAAAARKTIPFHIRSSEAFLRLRLLQDQDNLFLWAFLVRMAITIATSVIISCILLTAFGVWLASSSHVIFAEVVHSVADFANQALLAYGLSSSRRAPDAIHPYGYSKERFVWSLISAVGIFCLGSGATVVHGFQNLWTAQPPDNMKFAALVIGGSFVIEGASLLVAIKAVKEGAAAEGMKVREYIWRGHDPTSVAVMTEDGAAVTGLVIAGASLVAVNATGNAIYDPIGSIIVGNLLGMVAIFLIQRNRHALLGRAMDDHDMEKVLHFLKNDPVVDALYDCKSEVIGPGFFRFKAEIGTEIVTALGSEVDRLEKEIQDLVPGIRHVDIEAHNPTDG